MKRRRRRRRRRKKRRKINWLLNISLKHPHRTIFDSETTAAQVKWADNVKTCVLANVRAA